MSRISIIIIAFCAFLALQSYGQKKRKAVASSSKIDNIHKDTTLFKINLNKNTWFAKDTDLSHTYVPIADFNVSLKPPAHFIPYEKLKGFIHPGSSSTIQVNQVTGTPYVLLTNALTPEYFNSQGLKLEKVEEVITSDAKKGLLYISSFKLKGMQYERMMLFTGDYTRTVWVNANYPAMVKFLLYDEMKKSLLSVKF